MMHGQQNVKMKKCVKLVISKNSFISHVRTLNTSNRCGWIFHQLRVQIYFLHTALKLLPLIK